MGSYPKNNIVHFQDLHGFCIVGKVTNCLVLGFQTMGFSDSKQIKPWTDSVDEELARNLYDDDQMTEKKSMTCSSSEYAVESRKQTTWHIFGNKVEGAAVGNEFRTS